MEKDLTPSKQGKHVTAHFPVAKLPPELRNGLKPGAHVRVTIEEEKRSVKKLISLRALIGYGKGAYPQPGDAGGEIRKLRDEWED